MAEIVLGVGASHSTLMNTHWDQVTHADRAHRFLAGLDEARACIAASQPDTAIIVGSNHFRGFWLDLIPAFTIGLGQCVASGESGTPSGPQHVDTQLARHIAETLINDSGFDIAYSARMQIDHGQSHAIQYLLAGLNVAIVPLVVNVFAPPLPTMKRCEELGRALRSAISRFPGQRRVAVIGSGGLSHRLPWPDWRHPEGDDDEFMVRAWLDGRNNWQEYDGRRREIIRAASPTLSPDFDDAFLTMLETGQARQLCSYSTERLAAEAGNGGQEVRTWLVMAAAMEHARARRLVYEQMPEWLTGMAVAVIEPDELAGSERKS